MAQKMKNLTAIHEYVGLSPGLVQWVKESSIALSSGVGYGCGLDLPLLWLWHKGASCSSDSTPSLVTSICHKCGPKKTKKERKKPRSHS